MFIELQVISPIQTSDRTSFSIFDCTVVCTRLNERQKVHANIQYKKLLK